MLKQLPLYGPLEIVGYLDPDTNKMIYDKIIKVVIEMTAEKQHVYYVMQSSDKSVEESSIKEPERKSVPLRISRNVKDGTSRKRQQIYVDKADENAKCARCGNAWHQGGC